MLWLRWKRSHLGSRDGQDNMTAAQMRSKWVLLICDAKTKHPIMLPITFSVLRGLTGLLSVQYAMSLNIKRASYAFQQQRSKFQFPFPSSSFFFVPDSGIFFILRKRCSHLLISHLLFSAITLGNCQHFKSWSRRFQNCNLASVKLPMLKVQNMQN